MSSHLPSAAGKPSLSPSLEKAFAHIYSLGASWPVQLFALSPPLDVIFITGIKLSNKV